MENLTLEEINELIAKAGANNIVADSAEFRQINASNEAHYRITYGSANNSIFIIQREDGKLRASINTLL